MSKSVNSPSSRNSWKPSRRNVLKGLGATAVATAAAPAIKVRADEGLDVKERELSEQPQFLEALAP